MKALTRLKFFILRFFMTREEQLCFVRSIQAKIEDINRKRLKNNHINQSHFQDAVDDYKFILSLFPKKLIEL